MTDIHISVKNLTMKYHNLVIQENLNFDIKRGEVFVIMGGNACGKTTLMKHLIGLKSPSAGKIIIDDIDFWNSKSTTQKILLQRIGVLYQGGALWRSMTLAENIALPLTIYTSLTDEQIHKVVLLKLSLVGLSGFENFYPSELSGGMQKRAGLARAMALDPEILFFDEPTSGLDPINAKLMDNLILKVRDTFGTTIVMVSHELASIFDVADNAVYLDTTEKTMTAMGNPKTLLKESTDPKVLQFLTRSEHTEPNPAHSTNL